MIGKRLGVLAVAVGLLTLGLGGVANAADEDLDCTTETTGWVTESPGAAWVQVDQRTVTDKDATEGSYTEWENQGEPVVTEENNAPGENTDTVRWFLLGETDPEVVTEAQHYSYKGGPIEGTPAPPSEDPDAWQANTTQEPHYQGGATPAQQPDDDPYTDGESGLHYTSHGSEGLADWFFFQAEVTDVDYIWQKQVREWVPGNDAETHKEYKFELTTCEPTDDNEGNPPPKENPGPPAASPPAAELPATGPAGLGLMSLIATALIGSGAFLYRRFGLV